MKYSSFTFLLFFTITFVFGQQAHDSLMMTTSPNFFQIRDAFEQAQKKETEKKDMEEDGDEARFERWEYYWKRRINPDGSFPSPNATMEAWSNYVATHGTAMARFYKKSGNWNPIGPLGSTSGDDGIGRISAIVFHPKDSNTVFVGTPNGGLWKSTDYGNTWTTNTDNLPVMGVADIAIHPDTPDIMYIATGDKEAYQPSMGILKSINGGLTWDSTGISWATKDKNLVRKLALDVFHPNTLLAATSGGIYRTVDGGTTWTNVQAGHFMDIVYKPGSDSIAYATSKQVASAADVQIWRTTDAGQTWSKVTSFTNAGRIQLAVTPQNPESVKAIVSLSNSLFGGIYASYNSGSSFEQIFSQTTLNLIGSSSSGLDFSYGQGWYDLCIAVSPFDTNLVYAGGINTWGSNDGGRSWSIKTLWTNYNNPNNVQIVHADKHVHTFHPFTGDFWEGNDGGVFRKTGTQPFVDKSGNMQIGQIYTLASCEEDATIQVVGLQDNGCKYAVNGNWYRATGGDGLQVASDPRNDQVFYTSSQYGDIYRTDNQFMSYDRISNNMPNGQEQGSWLTPFKLDPSNPDIMYAAFKCVYKVTDEGFTWTPISTNLTTNNLTLLAVAPSDPQTIYTSDGYGIFATTNGGTNWTKVKSSGVYITSLVVSPFDAKKIYYTYGGYGNRSRVFVSSDGGKTWTNISGSLPNVPAFCLVLDKYSSDMYVGTDVGVFYRDSTMSDWQLFSTGLPNTTVNDLSFHYKSGKIRAATYGRGAWETDMAHKPVLVGIQEVGAVREKQNIEIYPNPNRGTFVLKMNGAQAGALAHIYNYLGQQLKTISLTGAQTEIQLHEMPDGVYYIGLSQGGAYSLKPLIISR